MDRQKSDLGFGVSVIEGSDLGLEVTSAEVVLPWRPRAGPFVGTAITWGDQVFEALTVERGEAGERWQLARWPEGEVTRNVDSLDAGRIENLVVEAAALKQSQGMRWLLILMSPLAGLMPAPLQKRWEREHNVPAARATVISAVLELVPATWWIINPGSILYRFFGLLLFVEALVRLWSGLSNDEPIGSFLTAPVGWFLRPPPKAPSLREERVEVVGWNQDGKNMTLAVSTPRADWVVDGIIRFRDALYRLVDTKFGGDKVAYYFEAVPPETPVTLSLVAPRVEQRRRDSGRGFLADLGRFIFLAFAPRRFQERLAPTLNLGVRTLTWISAGVEVFGGVVNLMGSTSGDFLIGVDLLIFMDGAWRLVRTAATGKPVGSVFGLPFIAVYERWLRSAAAGD